MKHQGGEDAVARLKYLAARVGRAIAPVSPVLDGWADELRAVSRDVQVMHEELQTARLLAQAQHAHINRITKDMGLNKTA